MIRDIIHNRIKKKRTEQGRRISAFVLCLAMLISFVPSIKAKAAITEETKKFLEDLHMIRVDTGTASGENVMYLGIRFVDDTGNEHTEYVFPHEGDLAGSYDIAASYGIVGENRLKMVKDVTKYAPSGYKNLDGLRSNSTDTYLFNPRYKVAEILSVDVFMRNPMTGSRSNGWTCNGIYVYDVNSIDGLNMAGYYSNDYFIQFSGTLLGYMKAEHGSVDFSLNGSDCLFRIGREATNEYTFVPANEPYSNASAEDEYLLKIDFADVYDGGIEALASEMKDDARLLYPIEPLAIALTYMDTFGSPRYVTLPAITSALSWAVESGFTDSTLPIAGIAQQGESVMFPCRLPDFQSLYSVQLVYGPQANETAGVQIDIGLRGTERLKAVGNETFQLSGISLYPGSAKEKVVRGPSTASLDLLMDETCKPLYYYTSSLPEGDQVFVGGSDYKMKAYSSGASLKPTTTADTFIVQIKTDSIEAAATTEDLRFFVTYTAIDGTTKSTTPISLREAAQAFYGYWPGVNGDVSYLAGVSAGGTLTFPMKISGVKQFLSATFEMDSQATDDWQMAEIAIYYPSWIERRTITWKDIGVSNREITRNFDSDESARVAWYPNLYDIEMAGENGPEKLFLNGKSNRKTVTFSGAGGGSGTQGGIGEQNTNYINWSDIQYSMTYREALQDLGFSHTAVTYSVDVQVANNDGIGANDDCGSSNLFYFKLLFENGSSGFVLANQQLTSDGFRAGRKETFYISTNEDYGPLTAVAIIPETESESDNRDIFDKLNVSSIRVTKADGGNGYDTEDLTTAGGMSQFWTISDVGWIGIEYFDKGAESTVSGREGRTEGELARVYSVTEFGYALNLLFTMTTGSYDKRVTDVDYTIGAKYPQYEGTLTATIEYYDSKDVLQKMSVDVARAMYEYADKVPQYLTDKDGNQLSSACVDPSFMLREGHVDRFIVSIPDIKQLARIRFNASGLVSTTWKLENVGAWVVKSGGAVQLTADGEYKRTNQIEALCESTSTIGYTLKTIAPDRKDDVLGEAQELPVSFTSGVIDVTRDESAWGAKIKREPTNRNDTINVYVYMGDGANLTGIRNYDLNAVLQYHNALDDTNRQIAIHNFRKDTQRNMFYATGLKADGMDTANLLRLETDSANRVYASLDHIVVQHVRSGVTIETYYIECNNASLDQPREYNPAAYIGEAVTEEQLVRLYFSPDMEETIDLIPEQNDVVVAIRYKTVNDVGEVTYNSRYVYLTDIKDEINGTEVIRYSKIKPGMIVDIPFNESCVSEIVGIVAASVGKIDLTVDSACVGVYDLQTGALVDWYNFAEPKTLTTTPKAMETTEDTVVPIEMRFTTYDSAKVLSSGSDSGNPAPIRMMLTYVNRLTGECETATIDNIRDYLVDGSFDSTTDGSNEATIRFFMKNVESIRYITLEPYTDNPYGSATWGLSNFYCETIIDKEQKSSSCTVNKLIVQESPSTINFSSVVISLTATYYDPAYGITYRIETENEGTADITLQSGQSITITPKISGTIDGMGYLVSVEQVFGNARTQVYCYSDNASTIRFTPPENETGSIQYYIITVCSEEMPDVKATLTVNVLPMEKSEEPEPENEDDPSGTGDDPAPTEPEEPSEPEEPTEPENPGGNDEPGESGESGEPEEPEESGSPEEPGESGTPEEPEESGESGESEG